METEKDWKVSTSTYIREFKQQDSSKKKRAQRFVSAKRDRALTYEFCLDLQLTLIMFSCLLLKDLFKAR